MKDLNGALWGEMKLLVLARKIIVDRLKRQPHPRYPDMIYPLDYGYLENTSASDGGRIDVWMGTQNHKTLTGILCTFDTLKQDAEIKLLLGCTHDDLQCIRSFYGNEMKILHIPSELQ